MKSSWFKKVVNQTDDLMQGDLIFNLRVPSLEVTDVASKLKIDKSVELNFITSNYIILTQSCDLSPENEKNITQVLLAPAPSLEDFLKENTNFSTQEKVKNILQNKTIGIFPIENPENKDNPMIVNEYYGIYVQLDVLETLVIKSRSKLIRYRMNSPYVEALANDFASLFNRPAIPGKFPHDGFLNTGKTLANKYNPSLKK